MHCALSEREWVCICEHLWVSVCVRVHLYVCMCVSECVCVWVCLVAVGGEADPSYSDRACVRSRSFLVAVGAVLVKDLVSCQ